MRGWISDLTYALRLLLKAPGFTFLAVLCLGLGIGANASIFSVLNALFLRPMPVHEPQRLVVLSRDADPLFSYPDYADLRDRSQSFTGLAVSSPTESSLDFEGSSYLAAAEPVSANYREIIGVRPFLGRWFANEQDPEAVISYRAWQRVFHGDANIIGKRVRSEAGWYTVVGVAPSEFGGIYLPLNTDIWVPFRRWSGQYPSLAAQMRDRANRRVMVFGRLKPGIGPGEAAAELNAIAERIRRENPGADKLAPIVAERVRGVPNPNSRRGSVPIAALLMSVVGLVLLIACVNVGNLLLARGAARQREFSVRVAVGAGRARLLRQLLTESLMLACLGGLAGVAFGFWSNRLLVDLLLLSPYADVMRFDLSIDSRVLILTAVVTFLTTLLFGLAPAWRASRADPVGALKGEAPSSGRYRLRRISLVAQVCMSLVLLLTSGLFLRVLLHFHEIDPGFAIENRIYAQTYVSRPEFTIETGRQFYAQALDRVRTLPSVENVAVTDRLPFIPATPGCVSKPGADPVPSTANIIDSGFLQTMRIRLVAGRNFSAVDQSTGPPVAIVNETLARRLWPGELAIGKRVQLGCRDAQALEVIGVARDSRFRSLGEPPVPHVYRPFSQAYSGGLMNIMAQSASRSDTMIETIRRTLLATNPSARIYVVGTMSAYVEQSYWIVRWEALALSMFGGLSLLLAAVGLYGVISYHVTLRTREIGIRVALGAERRDVFRLVIRQGMTLTLIGVALGLTISAMLARLLANFLYGVSPTDVITYASTALIWMVVSLAACYLPALRASRVQPIAALRWE